MIRPVFVAFSAVSLWLGGCASSTGSDVARSSQGTDPAAFQGFCSGYCANIKACDAKIDERTCANACENANAALFPKLRTDVVEAVSACFDDKDCKTTLSGNYDAACMKEAQAKTAPSTAAVSFCEALNGSRSKCKVSSDKSSCLNAAKVYADEVLADAELCAKNACSDVDVCVAAALAIPAGATLGGGGASTNTSASDKPSTVTSCTNPTSVPGASSACNSCLSGKCCGAMLACTKDGGCLGVVTMCAQTNGNTTSCQTALNSASSTTRALATAVSDCDQAACARACFGDL